MGVVVAGRLAFEVSEDVVAEVELDLARGADDDLAADVEEDGGEGCDEKQTEGVVDDLCFSDAVLHIVDGVADDEGDENFNDVVEHDREPAPGEVLPISPEVGCEGSEFFEHIDSSYRSFDQMRLEALRMRSGFRLRRICRRWRG